METLPDRVPVLPVENYPNPTPEEKASRLGTNVELSPVISPAISSSDQSQKLIQMVIRPAAECTERLCAGVNQCLLHARTMGYT